MSRVRRWRFVAILVDEGELVFVASWGERSTQGGCQRNQIRSHDGRVQQSSTGIALDDDVFSDHVDDIGIVEATGNGQLLQFSTRWGRDLNEHSIDRILDQGIVVDIRPDAVVVRCERTFSLITNIAEECFFKAIRGGADGRIRTVGDLVKGQRRTHIGDLYRIHTLLNRVDHNSAGPTVTDICIVNVLSEDPFIFEIESACRAVEVAFEDDPPPIPRGRNGCRQIGI